MAKAKQTTSKTVKKKPTLKKANLPRVADKKKTVGRKLMDGKSPKIVIQKLEDLMVAGFPFTVACKKIGISHETVKEYIDSKDGLAEYFAQLKDYVLWKCNFVLNEVMDERVRPSRQTYDSLGRKKTSVPSKRAVTIARFNKRSLDPMYAEKPQVNLHQNNITLTPEQKERLDGTSQNWQQKDPESYDV